MAQVFPTFQYHKEHGAKLFHSKEELEAAGPGWVDSPAKFDSKPEPAATKFVTEEAEEIAPKEGLKKPSRKK